MAHGRAAPQPRARRQPKLGQVIRRAIAACLLAAALAGPAHAADPDRWTETGRSAIPLNYYQGIASDPAKRLFFDGVYTGLYRTDPLLGETARNDDWQNILRRIERERALIRSRAAAAPPRQSR